MHPLIDITVPVGVGDRGGVLEREWSRQGGLVHPPPAPMLLPRADRTAYNVRIEHTDMYDLGFERQYSDEVAGVCGGPGTALSDVVTCHLTLSGRWHYRAGNYQASAAAGELLIRRNGVPWDFEVDRDTHSVLMSIPAGEVTFPRGYALLSNDRESPAVRLFRAHLRLCMELSDVEGLDRTARNAAVELLHGVLRRQVVDDEYVSAALVRAAQEHVDRQLGNPDLDPAAIAGLLHVSVRTLHRAFAHENTALMEYARNRRLDRVRAELATTSLSVGELAYRWHFTDASHLTRAYRKRFGRTPGADRRERLHHARGAAADDQAGGQLDPGRLQPLAVDQA